jgi:3-oxoacyl-[acyl-carrier protein] reductase
MRLAAKVAAITGAASGIGRASAIMFAREGAKVVIADVNDAGGQETESIIKSSGGEAIFVHTDVSRAADAENLIKTTIDKFSKIDILFNNAGIPQRHIPTENIDEALWDNIFAVNIKGMFLTTKYVIPVMKQARNGVIINLASINGVRPRPGSAAYASSKAAAIHFTKALALELAPNNIRVNCINPVSTDTPMLPKFMPGGVDADGSKKAAGDSIPLGRIAKPEDIAYAALYLASDESSMVTGASINVDGGRGI